jgi:hypothetical protein
MNIISNCSLCEKRSLYVIHDEVSQCLHCGFVTSDKFKGNISTNEEFKKLPENMQLMAKESNGQIWIPSVLTLPMGILNPIFVDDTLFWSFSPMVDIPKNEQKDYSDGKGGFYKKRYDNSQTKLYKEFYNALKDLNDKQETEIKLPNLKKIDG